MLKETLKSHRVMPLNKTVMMRLNNKAYRDYRPAREKQKA